MFFTIAISISLLAEAELATKDSNTAFLKAHEAQEAEILKVLSDKQIWTNDKRKREAANSVIAARPFRSKALVKLLAPHIDFAPYGDIDDFRRPRLRDKYPVVETLAAMGMIAVPDLLEVLKNNDPENEPARLELKGVRNPTGELRNELVEIKPRGKGDGTGAVKHRMAMHCLYLIYQRAGYGEEMLQKRIELEIKNTPVKERGFLKQ